MEDKLLSIITEITGIEMNQENRSRSMRELEIDSLFFLEILYRTEEETGTEIHFEQIDVDLTPQGLCALFLDKAM